MKLLQLFIAWWNAEPVTQRQRVNAHKAVPSDHFDKFGHYIFKEARLGEMAQVLRGATMSTVTFGTPVVVNGGAATTSLAFAMSGVTSGQPIVLCILCPGLSSIGSPTFADTFAGAYSYTKIDSGNSTAGGFAVVAEMWVATSGSGASGTITISGLTSSSYGGTATSCIGASTSFGGSVIDVHGNVSGNSSGANPNFPAISPTSSGGGAIGAAVFAGVDGGVTGLSAPWVNTSLTIASSTHMSSTYASPPSGSSLGSNWWSPANAETNASVGAVIKAPPSSSAPSSPTLTSPANASYQDVSSGQVFTMTYNSTDGSNQNAYALRIKVSGGSYNYWNAGTSALQSSIVWNAITTTPSRSWSVTSPNTAISNAHVYNWSAASQESISNLQGSFASDFTFTAQATPSVVVNAPTGNVATNSPTVTWTDTLPGGSSQVDYQIEVESGSYGTIPGSGVSAWNSGVVSSAVNSVQVGVALTSTVTYRAFVQVTETGGQVSAWAYTTFTVTVDPPATPTITATPTNDPVTGAPRVTLTIQGNDNGLTAIQSSCEGGSTTGWAAGTNTTIAASSTWSQDGSFSLALTATAGGAVSATTPTGTSGVAVVAGQTVRAMAYFHSPTTARVCSVAIAFYNAAGALLSTSTSTTVNSTTTGVGTGAQAFISMTAPANAVFATLILNGAALGASEVLNADSMLVAPGSSTTWTIGGFVGTTTISILRSDGQYVRGAGWEGMMSLPTNQQLTMYDVEAAPATPYTYTATVTAVVGGLTLTSGASAVSASVTTNANNLAWLLDPTNPSNAVGFTMAQNLQPIEHEVGSTTYSLGYKFATKLTDGFKGEGFIINIFTSSIAQEAVAQLLRTSSGALLFMLPKRGAWYVMHDIQQDNQGQIPFSWESTTTPQNTTTYRVLQTARP
jgi:hypothetical protein